MGSFANSHDQDEMPHNAAFHLGLLCLLRQNPSLEKEIQIVLVIITCEPLIYTMDHPNFIVCSFMGNSICLKRGSYKKHIFHCLITQQTNSPTNSDTVYTKISNIN